MKTTVFQGEYFSIHLNAVNTEYIETGNEVLVVPLTAEGEVILTVEPSAAFGEPVLILPGGSTETDEKYAETASSELQEEIGYVPGQLDVLVAEDIISASEKFFKGDQCKERPMARSPSVPSLYSVTIRSASSDVGMVGYQI